MPWDSSRDPERGNRLILFNFGAEACGSAGDQEVRKPIVRPARSARRPRVCDVTVVRRATSVCSLISFGVFTVCILTISYVAWGRSRSETRDQAAVHDVEVLSLDAGDVIEVSLHSSGGPDHVTHHSHRSSSKDHDHKKGNGDNEQDDEDRQDEDDKDDDSSKHGPKKVHHGTNNDHESHGKKSETGGGNHKSSKNNDQGKGHDASDLHHNAADHKIHKKHVQKHHHHQSHEGGNSEKHDHEHHLHPRKKNEGHKHPGHVAHHARPAGGDKCKGESGLDYQTDGALVNLQGITSSDMCRQRCRDAPRCGAWTWGMADPWVEGVSHVCFLKKLSTEAVLQKITNDKVVSGLPCGHEKQKAVKPEVVEDTESGLVIPQEMLQRFDLSGAAPDAMSDPSVIVSKDGCDSLYCFALMIPHSYETQLLAWQYLFQASIFACNEYAVYSNESMEITRGLKTNVVNIDLTAQFGGEFGTALNTEIFMAAWRKVISDGRFAYHCWTVKADPDTVFLAPRLRSVLRTYPEDYGNGLYLNNCRFGMHGPLEVFSREGIRRWYRGSKKCFKYFYGLCNGPCLWGEDMFVDQCLGRYLNVTRKNVYNLLMEDHCAPPQGWEDCKDSSMVAFHPFKKLRNYQVCLHKAEPELYPEETVFDSVADLDSMTTTTIEPLESANDEFLNNRCAIKDGIDYKTHGSILALEGIAKQEICMARCREDKQCGVWTWGKARDRWGLTNVCFLKSLESGKMPKEVENLDVVSGLPCRKHSDHKKLDDDDKETRSDSKATLFCFALMTPSSIEIDLITWQYRYGASIFACSEAALYSNRSMQIGSSLATRVINIDLSAPTGGLYGSALNTDIFRAVWNEVVSDGRYALYDWTVKVDPDVVFLPRRLSHQLRSIGYEETERGLYFNNCKLGLRGALEVMSKNAVLTWYNGIDACYLYFYKLCGGPCLWGEAMFMDQCLKNRLKVARVSDYHLLSDEQCSPSANWATCQDTRNVAIHPLKSVDEFQRCLMNAEPDIYGGLKADG